MRCCNAVSMWLREVPGVPEYRSTVFRLTNTVVWWFLFMGSLVNLQNYTLSGRAYHSSPLGNAGLYV